MKFKQPAYRYAAVNRQIRPAVCIELDRDTWLALDKIARAEKINKATLLRPVINKFVRDRSAEA